MESFKEDTAFLMRRSASHRRVTVASNANHLDLIFDGSRVQVAAACTQV